MKKIVVPDGMLKAASAVDAGRGWCMEDSLEAALRWLVEQEIGDPMLANIVNNTVWSSYRHTARTAIHAYLNRMFVAPEPEVPEEIKDLLWNISGDKEDTEHNSLVIEAYRRGKESK